MESYQWSYILDDAHNLTNLTTETLYDYKPHLAPGVIYCVAFGLGTVIHIGLMCITRNWLMFVLMVLGCIGELIGWVGRTLSSAHPETEIYYLMQSITLMFAPCFFSALLYAAYGSWIRKIAGVAKAAPDVTEERLMNRNAVEKMNITVDDYANYSSDTGPDYEEAAGTDITIIGMTLQLVLTVVFLYLMAVYIRHATQEGLVFTGEGVTAFAKDEEDMDFVDSFAEKKEEEEEELAGNDSLADEQRTNNSILRGEREAQDQHQHQRYRGIMIVLFSLLWTACWILIRCIYRLVELGMGWHGYVNTHEWFITAFDAAPMVLVVYGLVLGHPGYWLKSVEDAEVENEEVEDEFEKNAEEAEEADDYGMFNDLERNSYDHEPDTKSDNGARPAYSNPPGPSRFANRKLRPATEDEEL